MIEGHTRGDQEAPFNLLDLIRAVEDAADVLEHDNLDEETRAAFQGWWEERKRSSVRVLERQLGVSGSARQERARLWYGLGAFILDPSRQAGQAVLRQELPNYILGLQRQLTGAQSDLSGHARPAPAHRVLIQQITELWGLRNQVRELRDAIDKALITSEAKADEIEGLKGLKKDLVDNVERELDDLLGKLDRLDMVVKKVCNLLPTAYRENNSAAWNAIEQWFAGWEDTDSRRPWVPQDLQTHKTLNWIRERWTELQAKRSKLERSIDEIIWCMRYEELEGERADSGFQSSTDLSKLRDRQWAQAKVVQAWSQADSPIEVTSLLEDGLERLRWLQQNAEPDGNEYEILEEGEWIRQNFVRGASEHFIRRIETRASLSSDTSLEDYLEDRVGTLRGLREQLHPILGGRLYNSEDNLSKYSAWDDVCSGVVQSVRAGNFAEAHNMCHSFLFSIGLKFQKEFEDWKLGDDLSDDFRQKFEDHEISPSDNLSIKTVEKGTKWQIIDPSHDQTYTVIKEKETLNIYSTPRPLREAIARLESITQSQENAPIAMTRMLRAEARAYLKELQAEKEKIAELAWIVDQLEENFDTWWSDFDWRLARSDRLSQSFVARLPILGRPRRRQSERVYKTALDAFKKCLRLCPDDQHVRRWKPRLAIHEPTPDVRDWCKEFLPSGLVCNTGNES